MSILRGLKIGVIGSGNMGQALVKGLVEEISYPQNIRIFDVDRKKISEIKKQANIRVAKSNRELASVSDCVILAVKPNLIVPVLDEINSVLGDSTLIISIAAGVRIKTLQDHLKKDQPVIRVMPNMPAVINQGISAFSLGTSAGAKHEKMAEAILSCLGEVIKIEEKNLDLVTALSGSGPAYFFLVVQKLIEAGHELGLKYDVSRKLVYQTALGSAQLLKSLNEEAEDLVSRVASKGGTTEAALKVFKKAGLGKILQDAVEAAWKRSKELSQGG